MKLRALLAGVLLLCAGTAAAQKVSLSGSLGNKALLMIDGTPRTLGVGEAAKGVKLLGVNGSEALVEVGGQRITLRLGQAHANLGGAASAGTGSQIVLTAGSGGHFVTQGSINGRAVSVIAATAASAKRPTAPSSRTASRWTRCASATCKSTTSRPPCCPPAWNRCCSETVFSRAFR